MVCLIATTNETLTCEIASHLRLAYGFLEELSARFDPGSRSCSGMYYGRASNISNRYLVALCHNDMDVEHRSLRQGRFQSVHDIRAAFLLAALEEDGVSNNRKIAIVSDQLRCFRTPSRVTNIQLWCMPMIVMVVRWLIDR